MKRILLVGISAVTLVSLCLVTSAWFRLWERVTRRPAPDARLIKLDGSESRLAAHFREEKPLVLLLGNRTCGYLNIGVEELVKLSEEFGDKADFLMVYCRESHPPFGEKYELEFRVEAAHKFLEQFPNFRIPIVVDTMDDEASLLYEGNARLYIIERGRIVYKGESASLGGIQTGVADARELLSTRK